MLVVALFEIYAIAPLLETVLVVTTKSWITAHVRPFVTSQESKAPIVQCHIP